MMTHINKRWIVTGCLLWAVTTATSYAQSPLPTNDQIRDRITLELQNVSIFDVFKILSKKSGLNIVAGKNVQGQVSIFLRDVPVEEAFKTILQSQGLASVNDNGIIKVIPEADYIKKFGVPYDDSRVTKYFRLNYALADELAAKLSDRKTTYAKIITDNRTNTIIITELPSVLSEMEGIIIESDKPQITETFHLGFTRVEDLEPKLKTFTQGSSGRIEIDKRSNRIIVSDIPSQVERIRALVSAFDVRIPQVSIDAKIVEVQLTDKNRKGINWKSVFDEVKNLQTVSISVPLTVSPPTGISSLATFTLGSEQNDFQVILDVLEASGKTNLLSSPKITVMNNEEASLSVATREPFVSQTIVQTTNSTNTADDVQFVDVGVTLKVRPRISQDEFVEMKIEPEVSSSTKSLELEGVASGSNTTFTRTKIPIVTTQVLETTVLIQSGYTLVIGGLIQDQQSKEITRVPILSDLPLLGPLFESNNDDYIKTELVVFLTPTIISPSEDAAEYGRFMTQEDKAKSFEEFGGFHTQIRNGVLSSKEKPYWEKS